VRIRRDMTMLLRSSVCVLLLLVGPFCFAQVVTVRVINAADGHPLQKQHVSVSLLYEKGEKAPTKYDANLSLETDANGEAHFTLPGPAPPHISAQVRLTSEQWRCGCGVLAATADVIQKGIVGPLAGAEPKKSAAPVKASPGEILFVARPLSFFERLLYPFVKG
jgi:hypothetical protein